MPPDVEIECWVEGPSWWKLKSFLVKCSIENFVQIKFTKHNKKILTETIIFSIKDTKKNVYSFLDMIEDSIEHQNKNALQRILKGSTDYEFK